MTSLRIALPNKGRLAEQTLEILELAGLGAQGKHERSLQATLGDGSLHALFVRAADIPELVADGAADLGITGSDLVAESGRNLDRILDLGFGRCRMAIAVREESCILAASEIPAGTRVATSFPNIARDFLQRSGIEATLVPVSGAAEIAPHIGVADVIIDLVSTGSTLRMNGLRDIGTILDCSAVLIARPDVSHASDGFREVRTVSAALESVLRARNQRYLMANVPRASLPEVSRILPGINGPTIVDVMNGGEHVAAHAVVEQTSVYRVIAELKALGATGILVTRIERLMP
jgi:ATP phosphoribosyltransferase